MRKMLRSKLHGARITHADVAYEGSITIPPQLMQAADLQEFEAVQVWNVSNGNRLETYVIKGDEASRDICINGAAAHLMQPGDTVIVGCFAFFTEDALAMFEPKLVFLDEHNNIKDIRKEVPGPSTALPNGTILV